MLYNNGVCITKISGFIYTAHIDITEVRLVYHNVILNRNLSILIVFHSVTNIEMIGTYILIEISSAIRKSSIFYACLGVGSRQN